MNCNFFSHVCALSIVVLWTSFMLQTIGKSSHFIILIFPFLNYFSVFNVLAIKNLHFKNIQAVIFETNSKTKILS